MIYSMVEDIVRYRQTNLNKQDAPKGLSAKDIKRAIAFTKIYFGGMVILAFTCPTILVISWWNKPLLFDFFGVLVGGVICFLAMLIPWGLAIWALIMMTIWGGKAIDEATRTIFAHRQQKMYNRMNV